MPNVSNMADMTFEARLAAHGARVESRLGALLGRADGGAGVPERLAGAVRYGALGGGKRFRPFLVMESAALFGLPPERAETTAAALECIHCYSLIHDDLPAMDDDALRRGKPTVHVAFDEATAILAGCALLTRAFEALAVEERHADPAVRLELISALARAAGWAGMLGGQALDLAAEKDDAARMMHADIARLQDMKTGALIRFACEAGAILAGEPATSERRAALRRYGTALGRAFQLSDDLLDAEGDAARTGKATGKDAARGKATFVAVLGVDGARRRLDELEAEALAALAPFGAAAAPLAEAARFLTRRRH